MVGGKGDLLAPHNKLKLDRDFALLVAILCAVTIQPPVDTISFHVGIVGWSLCIGS
jgi:hypothetical protein